jgi:hypothetical protein
MNKSVILHTTTCMSNRHMVDLQAFMRGKLKLKGNMAIAMKLNTVLDAARKAGKSPAPSSTSPAPTKVAPAPAAPVKLEKSSAPPASSLKSQPLFDAIALAVRADGPTFVKKVNGVIQFNVTLGSAAAPAAVYLLDLKSGTGSVTTNPKAGGPTPDITITIADDDFVALADGKLNPQAVSLPFSCLCCIAIRNKSLVHGNIVCRPS